ncbi:MULTISPECIES: hypothetical protein [Vibrio]|jgi:hypothetical protein|uniref:Uncharacterized protein n=1 Tax=Vibrio mediterranei TaxID=689 RepID=A0A3G4VGY9_9VIBR|nr:MULTISPECIES: hypothetical protein [Vibrio]AYV23258.1 hypothetical protein ECB94_18300 [Vibrio mediterranei]MDA0107155.1 hypothetical protein [Vibrio sp. La 4.2.2]NUW75400.1 hypothetical protein [Vibrio mediterranei]
MMNTIFDFVPELQRRSYQENLAPKAQSGFFNSTQKSQLKLAGLAIIVVVLSGLLFRFYI